VTAAFHAVAVPVAPGCERAYRAADWRDAIVVVERGEIVLEGLSGGRWRFRRGDVLWLCGLPLRALCNPGREPALLVAVSRTDELSEEGRSTDP
jgi:quercetin dioxygenase-like cupin family protein